jgi:hypothetical protein
MAVTTAMAGFARRWIVLYLVLTAAPFPLSELPGLDALVIAASAPWDAAVAWVGEHVFGGVAVRRFTGSGDTLFHYVSAACKAALAVVAALVWRTPSARAIDRARAYVRLYLGATLLTYGWYKLIPTQFGAVGPERLVIPIGDSSPMGLLWTFMGASVPYQMLTGLTEVVAGALLFWRRCAPLGALLALFVVGQVVALNYCYDVAVKLLSSHLLALALVLAAPDLPRLFAALTGEGPLPPRAVDPYPLAGRLRVAAIAGKLALLCVVTAATIAVSVEALYARGRLAPIGPLHGVYRVEAFERPAAAGVALDDAARWLRFAVNEAGLAGIQRADGSGERLRLTIDRTARTLTLTRIGGDERFILHYLEDEAGGLRRLFGAFEGAPTTVELRRQADPPALLSSRGFHWVQEAPFNR